MGSASIALQFGTAQLGIPQAIAWGLVRAIGNVLGPYQLADGSNTLFGILGEGEWDGPQDFWVDNALIDTTDVTKFHFHPGVMGTLGAGLAPSSDGGDQLVDNFWSLWPAGVQPQTFSGKAYYALHIAADPLAPTPNLTFMGDWRARKCRIFDNTGTQTAYQWTKNPAWWLLDAVILRSFLPEGTPNQALSVAEKARFDWVSWKAQADRCDAVLANGAVRFEGGIAIASVVQLSDAITQMLNMMQAYLIQDNSGKLSLRGDVTRASSFTLTSGHVLPGTFVADSKALRGAPNQLQGQYLEQDPPAQVQIDAAPNGAVRAANVETLQFTAAHGFTVGQEVVVVNVANASFNGERTVATVPDSTHVTFNNAGANATSGAGWVGTPEQRFLSVGPQLVNHVQHQNAVGARGPGMTRVPKAKPQQYDLGINTAERTQRILQFLAYRKLGLDQAPYLGPKGVSVTALWEAIDAAGNELINMSCGDVLTIDKSVSEEFQGDYEIMGYDPSPYSESAQGKEYQVQLTLLQVVAGAYTEPVRTLLPPVRIAPSPRGLGSSSTVVGGVLQVPGANVTVNSPVNTNNTAKLDSIDAGSDATGRVYDLVGGVGTSWTQKGGALAGKVFPSASFTGLSYTTKYYVVRVAGSGDDLVTKYVTNGSYSLFTDFNLTLNDLYLPVGSFITVGAGGTGGSSGGGAGGDGPHER